METAVKSRGVRIYPPTDFERLHEMEWPWGADHLVPLEQSELLAQQLREADVPPRPVEVPWANHSYDHASNFSWGGWGAQITRSTLTGFLANCSCAEEPQGLSDSEERSSRG